jgi:hypothetical protein
MPDFEPLDPAAPATVENVAVAVARLARYDEAMLAELVSEGRLREVFPFRLAAGTPPEDSLDEADVPQASPVPLSDEAFAQLLRSSMREAAAGGVPAPQPPQQPHGLLRSLASLLGRDPG